MKEYPFCVELGARAYECDMQGHVNNAVYLNYLEHARHEFLRAHDLDFAELVRKGSSLIVIKAELEYKRALMSGERFMVGVILEPVSPLRLRFVQDIYSLPDKKLILKARVIVTGLNSKGKPELPAEIRSMIETLQPDN